MQNKSILILFRQTNLELILFWDLKILFKNFLIKNNYYPIFIILIEQLHIRFVRDGNNHEILNPQPNTD